MAKKLCVYGILSAVCLVFSFVEHLVGLDFIAPGVKLGLSNSVALILILFGDVKGAFMVNIVRILLSGFLFSSPMALVFSLAGGVSSLIVMFVFSRIKAISFYMVSIFGAITHNLAQILCAQFLLDTHLLYYLPILLVSAVICGTLTAFISKLIHNKIKTYTN